MRVLVKYDAERILFAASFRCQSDVVHIIAGLKVAGGVCVWLKRSIRAVALEDDDRRRHRRAKVHFCKELGKNLAELFQAHAHLPDLFLAGISYQQKVLRAHPGPGVLRRYRMVDRCKESKSQDSGEDNSGAFHRLNTRLIGSSLAKVRGPV